jgi:hypothetical protein
MSRKERNELHQLSQSDDTPDWVLERKTTRANRRENARKYRREDD